ISALSQPTSGFTASAISSSFAAMIREGREIRYFCLSDRANRRMPCPEIVVVSKYTSPSSSSPNDRIGTFGSAMVRFSVTRFFVLERRDLGRDIVAVEIVAVELRQAFAAIDVAAGVGLADVVVVLPDRLGHLVVGIDAVDAEGMQTFADAPAVVAAFFDDVD